MQQRRRSKKRQKNRIFLILKKWTSNLLRKKINPCFLLLKTRRTPPSLHQKTKNSRKRSKNQKGSKVVTYLEIVQYLKKRIKKRKQKLLKKRKTKRVKKKKMLLPLLK